jgi:hypothetical protein
VRRFTVIMPPITEQRLFKTEEQFPKELNVAVALILGQKQDLSPDILLKITSMRVPYIFYLFRLHVDSVAF